MFARLRAGMPVFREMPGWSWRIPFRCMREPRTGRVISKSYWGLASTIPKYAAVRSGRRNTRINVGYRTRRRARRPPAIDESKNHPRPARPGMVGDRASIPTYAPRRVLSNRNQARRSASSIQFSKRLVVATSLCSDVSSCSWRISPTSCLLSSRSSASISSGVT